MQNCPVCFILFSFSSVPHPALFLNYWPCWATADSGSPPDPCLRTHRDDTCRETTFPIALPQCSLLNFHFWLSGCSLVHFLFFQLPFWAFTFPVSSNCIRSNCQNKSLTMEPFQGLWFPDLWYTNTSFSDVGVGSRKWEQSVVWVECTTCRWRNGVWPCGRTTVGIDLKKMTLNLK